MRFLPTLLMPAGLLACASPQIPTVPAVPATTIAATMFQNEEEWINAVRTCGIVAYPDVTRMERQIRASAERSTLLTKEELLQQATRITRDAQPPSAAGCVNARNQWRALVAMHGNAPETRYGETPIQPATVSAIPSTARASQTRYTEFDADATLVVQGVRCQVVDPRAGTMLLSAMARYWAGQLAGESREALITRATANIPGAPAISRADCPWVINRLTQILALYRTRLESSQPVRRKATPPPALPAYRLKEPDARRDPPGPTNGQKITPEDVTDL